MSLLVSTSHVASRHLTDFFFHFKFQLCHFFVFTNDGSEQLGKTINGNKFNGGWHQGNGAKRQHKALVKNIIGTNIANNTDKHMKMPGNKGKDNDDEGPGIVVTSSEPVIDCSL